MAVPVLLMALPALCRAPLVFVPIVFTLSFSLHVRGEERDKGSERRGREEEKTFNKNIYKTG